jgi:hypothetical protein
VGFSPAWTNSKEQKSVAVAVAGTFRDPFDLKRSIGYWVLVALIPSGLWFSYRTTTMLTKDFFERTIWAALESAQKDSQLVSVKRSAQAVPLVSVNVPTADAARDDPSPSS